MIIYYVGWRARISGVNRPLHATIMYSRQWFQYKALPEAAFPITTVGPFAKDKFGDLIVLRFDEPFATARHEQFLASGASWDFDDFKSHITGDIDPPEFITFTSEYYGTWEKP